MPIELRVAGKYRSFGASDLRAVFDHAAVGMALRGLDGEWLAVNQKLCAMFGYSEAELLSMTSVQLTPPDERDQAVDFNVRMKSGQLKAYSRLKRYLRKDGSIVSVMLSVSVVDGDDGQPSHLVSVIQDMSEQARLRAELTSAAQQLTEQLRELKLFKAVIDGSKFGVTIVDARDRDLPIVYVNPAFLELTGYPQAEVLGRNCRFLRGPNTDPSTSDRIRAAVTGHEAIDVELVNYRRNGEAFWNRLNIFPVADTDGQRAYLVGYQSDISEQRQAAETRAVLERDLREARSAKALGQIVAGAAHEINNPIGVSLTAITHARNTVRELVRKLNLPAAEEFSPLIGELDEAIELTHTNLQRGIDLVRSLKEVAVNQSTAHWRSVPVKETVETILTTLRPILRKAGCALSFVCDTNSVIQTDPGVLSQIAQNLLLNCVNHAFEDHERDRRIDVAIKRSSDTIQISFRDNGRGISPELMETLFLPFVTSRRGKGGSGLGLHIARELASNKLHGSLALISGERGQTEFLLSIPARADPPNRT